MKKSIKQPVLQENQSLLVVASYPPKGAIDHRLVVGGASYTKRTMLGITKALKNKHLAVTVLAEKLPGQKQTSYKEGPILVKRTWQRGSVTSLFSLTREILKQRQTKHVLFEFELAMFGNMLMLLAIPFLLLLLRLFGKKIVFVFHQVIINMDDIYGHINLKKKSRKTWLLSNLAKLFYRIMLKLTNKAIVFDEVLKARLIKLGNADKVTVIPLAVEQFPKPVANKKARSLLGLPKDSYLILAFGFLAWYKGTDWLVEAFSQLPAKAKKHLHLVLAGGPNPNHLDKPFYQNYVSAIEKKCQENNIILTGFIPEEQMPLYFQASDLVVFPYRTLMSASAPLSFTFSFHKPFLLSNKLAPILKTEDIAAILQKESLSIKELTFPLDKHFAKTIQNIENNISLQQKLKILGKKLSVTRSWQHLGDIYYDTIFTA